MAEGTTSADGDQSLFTRNASPTIVLPSQEPKNGQSAPRPARNITPRGQRFSKLSDAYLNITSRLASTKAARKPLDQPQSNPAGPAQLPVASPRLAKSQDELQIPSPPSDMRAFMKKTRRASLDSTNLLGDLSACVSSSDSSDASLSRQIDQELSKLNALSHDTTSSTIERIVAQYDGCTPSLKAEYDNTREYRANSDLPISQPPQESLPESPPANTQPTSHARQSEYDSPVPDSSVTDSQHLLDAEAQAHELEEARRALVPLPLNLPQAHHEAEVPRQQRYDVRNSNDDFMEHKEGSRPVNPFAHPDDKHYQTYLQPPMERDISQRLRYVGGYPGHSGGRIYSPKASGHPHLQQPRPQEQIFSQSSLPTVNTGERPVRHIKVVIGRDSETRKNSQGYYGAPVDARYDGRDLLSEDPDWVTEATTDAGFGFSTGVLPGRPLTGGFKKAGSSLADYSDEGHGEDILDRFGSRERIIQHPAGPGERKPYDFERSKGSKFSAFLPRRQNPYPVNSRWEITPQGETTQFRPQILPKNRNPYKNLESRRTETSGRLVFDFDENAPPRYEFRDSVSEYEPAGASTKANCGTNQYDTHGSLPSMVSDYGENNQSSPPDVQFNKSADCNANKIPSHSSKQQSGNFDAILRDQHTTLSIYAADRQKQLEELDNREFAAASSYYDPPSASSVRSKFNFELLPLDLAQQRNKVQRYSGKTNETESAAARIKRKQSLRSSKGERNSIEQPPKAFFTSRDLSINFSSPNWPPRNLELEDTPTPFAMGHSKTTSSESRKYGNVSSVGVADNSSSFSTQSVTRRLWYSPNDHRLVSAQNEHQYKLRPTLTAPDDYVSDRAAAIRQSSFYILAVLSTLPFVGVLVLTGAFSDCLKWATRGEVDRLNSRQRRFIKWMLFVEAVLYAGGVVTVVVYFVVKGKVRN
ncbi:hypothetical protein F4678DRAFT_484257 [Xylaria arbuscula]|nr:hypothetical protein F4678DRAFT_484257 [Xylaria arbuscula]